MEKDKLKDLYVKLKKLERDTDPLFQKFDGYPNADFKVVQSDLLKKQRSNSVVNLKSSRLNPETLNEPLILNNVRKSQGQLPKLTAHNPIATTFIDI